MPRRHLQAKNPSIVKHRMELENEALQIALHVLQLQDKCWVALARRQRVYSACTLQTLRSMQYEKDSGGW